jgi:hypothetical protein
MKTAIQSFLVNHGTGGTASWRGALLLLVALALLAGPGAVPSARASASPPDTMTYQGFLVDGNGNPLAPTTPQNYPVIFRIYAVSSGAGAALWAEQQIVTVDKGNFSVLLGEGTPVGGEARPALSSVFAGNTASDRYIDISVTIAGTTTEILPRLRLVPSPYAFLATSASSLVQPNGTPFINFDGGQVNLAGNVGIGTPAAGKRLQVGDQNTANSEGMIRLASRSGTGGASRIWDFGVPETDQDSSGTGYSFVIDDAERPGTEFIVKWGSGNVGIGTATPNAPLSFGGGLANTKLALWDAGPGNMIGLGIQGAQFRLHLANSGDRFSFLNGIAGAELLTIQGNGNVGIGTTTPGRRFHVNTADTVAGRFDSSHTAGTWLSLGNSSAGGRYWQFISSGSGNSEGAGKLLIGSGDFDGNTTIKMTVQDNGNVGIGTGINAPVAKLQVKDPNSDAGRIHVGGVGANALPKLITFGDGELVSVGENGNDDILELKGNRIHMIGNVGIGIQDTPLPLAIQHNTDSRLRVQYPNGSYADFGRNSLGVGTGGALYLQLNNNHFGAGNRSAVYDGDNNWDFLSDRRLKKDIVDAESMLDRAMQVQVRRYRWKTDASEAKHQLGVVAQEVQPLFPELVSEFEDPNTKEKDLAVGYGDFALIAIKSLQELKRDHDAELTKLKTQLATLARENAELTSRNQQRDDRLAALEGLVKKLAEVSLDGKKAADAGGKEQENEAAAVAPTNVSNASIR